MVYCIIAAAIILIDFIAKRCVMANLMKIDTIPLWKDVFHLTYVENRGAAFGIMQNQRWFFIVLTVVILAVILIFSFRQKNKKPLMCVSFAFLSGGAIGNLIDRVVYGYVVDFLDFRLIDFPVFNVADVFVVMGAILLAVYFIFYDKEEKEKSDYERNNS